MNGMTRKVRCYQDAGILFLPPATVLGTVKVLGKQKVPTGSPQPNPINTLDLHSLQPVL